jgi:hypothetical protein
MGIYRNPFNKFTRMESIETHSTNLQVWELIETHLTNLQELQYIETHSTNSPVWDL